MKVEIELPDETAAAIVKQMARVSMPASALPWLLTRCVEHLGEDNGFEVIYGDYPYPTRAVAEKVASNVGKRYPGGESVEISYRSRGRVVTQKFDNPHGRALRRKLAKQQAARDRRARLELEMTCAVLYRQLAALLTIFGSPSTDELEIVQQWRDKRESFRMPRRGLAKFDMIADLLERHTLTLRKSSRPH